MRVAVGLSGGVDSAVAAALLMEAGHEVIGATMRIWDGRPLPRSGERGACYGPDEEDDVRDAGRVAAMLGIPHYVFNLAAEYTAAILEPCLRAYRDGTTPNPCVHCNRLMKFGLLVSRLRADGIACDAFATGHYARIRRDEAGGRFLLCRARDHDKDQSYFLYQLTQAQLAAAIFPLGELSKAAVRARARTLDLPVATRPESQDFVSGGYQGLLADPGPPGAIVDEAGHVLGRHMGIAHYTIGQRRGLGISASEPMYVIAIEPARSAIVVGPASRLFREELTAGSVNWIAYEPPATPRVVRATARYRNAGCEAVVTPLEEGRVRVRFAQPQRAITPGQAVVFYEDDVVLGGGLIESAGTR
jgi:tRNA-specific 2-thiouridylase